MTGPHDNLIVDLLAADGVLGNSVRLSTRQLLRMGRRLAMFPSTCVKAEMERATLAAFMPTLLQSELDKLLIATNFLPCTIEPTELELTVRDGHLSLGDASLRIRSLSDATKVPRVYKSRSARCLNLTH